jgi:CheY-like chemotaxis protein
VRVERYAADTQLISERQEENGPPGRVSAASGPFHQVWQVLTSEKGGKITCTAANGCTQAWPETVLTHGTAAAKAGPGVQSSLLGTVKDASGQLEITYNHWPLYTFPVTRACTLRPYVMLLDLFLPGMDGMAELAALIEKTA